MYPSVWGYFSAILPHVLRMHDECDNERRRKDIRKVTATDPVSRFAKEITALQHMLRHHRKTRVWKKWNRVHLRNKTHWWEQ
jgi:hypothetical protein